MGTRAAKRMERRELERDDVTAERYAYGCGHSSYLRQARCPGCGKGLLIQRHSDHGPGVICRPAGFGLCEIAPLGG